MNCPWCGFKSRKARLDVYWCDECERAWMFHKLNYKSFEEAAKTYGNKNLFHLSP